MTGSVIVFKLIEPAIVEPIAMVDTETIVVAIDSNNCGIDGSEAAVGKGD